MAMNEHDTIRELLALATAGVLTPADEQRVAEHVRSCAACANELAAWQPIASALRQLPTPQPSPWLVPSTVARAQAKLAEQAEHEWNRRAVFAVVAFSWLLMLASRAVFPTWISFAAFTAVGWLAGAAAAVRLAVRRRDEGRLA